MVDYIIVGFGLAGLSFVEQLDHNEKTFLVYEDASQMSSRVAGGLYNPVILKRFTASWSSSEQLKKAIPFYKNIENKLNKSFIQELQIKRRFTSVEEQNMWFEACDKPILKDFLSINLVKNDNKGLDIPYHFGIVNHTGRVGVKDLLSVYLTYLKKKDQLILESFDYKSLCVGEGYVEYKGRRAKNILFAEGYGVVNNPFFNYLPIVGNKGEYIVIKSDDLQLREAVKSSIFIIPLGGNLYKVGATYNNNDKSPEITAPARKELQEKLERFMTVDYEIIEQQAGIRPTTKDRKPIIGTHVMYKNIHILNGLGSRGILAAPSMANALYRYIEKKETLEKEVDIKRFEKLR